MLPLRRLLLITLIYCFAAEIVAAATLYLPRQFAPSEMATTGIALVNPTLTAAAITFRLRNAQGSLIGSAPGAIPAKGQLAVTMSQLFSGNTSSGWLSVDTDVDPVTGFWMSGDFVNSTDGARLLTISDA